MELWIRNQDRENLVKVELLEIQEREEDYMICTMFQNEIAHLGIYATKERALEVLDEIQKYINNECEFLEREQHTSMGTYKNKEQMHVYEMPKD